MTTTIYFILLCIVVQSVCFENQLYDDSINCNNTNAYFRCKTDEALGATCIPKSWLCDDEADCWDSSDEKNCPFKKCDETEFQCDFGKCIDKKWRCDGTPDCNDSSDEENCGTDASCRNKILCKTGHCYTAEKICDLNIDCFDDHRKLNCEQYYANCTETEFRCKNKKQCINKVYVCDGEFDCHDESDEQNCGQIRCSVNHKSCDDGKSCVAFENICNGKKDCMDGSDELNCSTNIEQENQCKKNSEFRCPDNSAHCIKFSDLCVKGVSDNDCGVSVCTKEILECNENTSNCKCRKTSLNGKICHCNDGFKNQSGICEDINECEIPGICAQICTNKYGSYECSCHPGYKLTIGSGNFTGPVMRKCRAIGPNPKLLLTNRVMIRQYDLVNNKYHPLINNLSSAVALDYWHKNQTLIWSDVSTEQIMICHMGNHSEIQNITQCLEHGNVTLLKENVKTPDGLAVDWVHGLLFWTDTGLNTISVYDLNKKRKKVLFDKGLDEPRAIAVDPTAGLIFWTDWGNNASIERAGMDGQNRKVLVYGDSLKWPNGLAVDLLDRRIYWVDAKLRMISSCDYNGRNLKTILSSHEYLHHPFSLAVFAEELYWTDWQHERVMSANKFLGNDVRTIINGSNNIMSVRVYHQQAQPEHPNKCKQNDCDHLCLPVADFGYKNYKKKMFFQAEILENEIKNIGLSYTCACEIGYNISSSNASLCILINPITESLLQESESRISILYFFLLIMVLVVLSIVFVQYRQRPAHFSVLHFDNPIYRRTVEDLDVDMEGLPDNSLGALPITELAAPNTKYNEFLNKSNGKVLFSSASN